jgi:tetratricopeptide (TPR) repeat protein
MRGRTWRGVAGTVAIAVGMLAVHALAANHGEGERQPESAETLNELGLTYRAQGLVPAAIAAFQRAAALRPTWGGPELNLADTYRAAERYRDALHVLRDLEARPVEIPRYRIYNALALVYLDMDQHKEAEHVARQALALAAHYVPARISLALALFEQRRYPEATQEFEAVVELEMKPDTVFFLCQLYALQRQEDTTLACLARALAVGIPAETVRKEALFFFIRTRPEYSRLVGTTP